MTNWKFRRVIGNDPKIVSLMQLLGFRLGFGDMSLDEVCRQNGISLELLTTLCEIYTADSPQVDIEALKTTDIPVVMRFVRSTHKHYLENSFVTLHDNVHRMADFCSAENAAIVNRFFDEYDAEMKRHINFEDNVVLKYIDGLLRGEKDSLLSVGMITEMHSNVEEKLEDFKNIVMNYLPAESTSDARYEVLIGILNIEDAIKRHTAVEEKVLLPLAEKLEQEIAEDGLAPKTTSVERPQTDEGRQESILSDREKEIVTEVAKGLTNKEIADKLCISVFTVTTHRKNITQKLGIKTIAGLTVYALMNGFLRQEDIEL